MKSKIILFMFILLLAFSQSILAQKGQPAPPVDSIIYNDGKVDYATSSAKFSIASKDTISEVKSILFKVDKGDFIEYQKSLSIPEEGPHTIYYYSIDNVGNQSTTIAYPVVIDNTPPDVSLSPDFKLYSANNKLYAPLAAKFSIVASDALSGVKSIEYTLGASKYQPYKTPITIGKAGDETIKFKATDFVGNTAVEKTLSFFVDNVKPMVKIIPSGSFYQKNNRNYAPKSFQYTIEASDTESGIARILVSLDGGEFVVYESPISFETEGDHTIVAKAIDNVGNTSDEIRQAVTVDISPPNVELKPEVK